MANKLESDAGGKKEKIDFKGIGFPLSPNSGTDTYSPEHPDRVVNLRKMLSRYGHCSPTTIETETRNGAWSLIFTPHKQPSADKTAQYLVVVPASDFRKKSVPASEVGGEGEHMVMAPRSPEDLDAMSTEVEILLINAGDLNSPGKVPEEDIDLIDRSLTNSAFIGHTQGGEIEYGLTDLLQDTKTQEGKDRLVKRTLSVARDAITEAFMNMREYALDASPGFTEQYAAMKLQLESMFDETNAKGFLLDTGSVMTQKSDLGSAPFTTLVVAHADMMPESTVKILPYVEGATHAYTKRMLRTLPEVLNNPRFKLVADAYGQIAKDKGYGSAEELIKKHLFNVWMTRALHYSIGIPQHADGMVPENAVRNIINLELLYSEYLDANNYSGAMGLGTEITAEDSHGKKMPVLSARRLLSNIMLTSGSPGLIGVTENVRQLAVEGFLRGGANSIDRTGGGKIIVRTAEGFIDARFAPMHSHLRTRTSTNLARFMQYLQELEEARTEEAISAVRLSTGARIENTSRDMTAEIAGGNLYSIALQNVLHRAGLMATAEGETDVIAWLEKKGLLAGTTKDDIYRTHSSEGIHNNHMNAIRGIFDDSKADALMKMIALVRADVQSRLKERYRDEVPKHWEKVFEYAERGVRNIQVAGTILNDERVRAHEGALEEGYKGPLSVIDTIRIKWRDRDQQASAGVEMYDFFVKEKLGIAGLSNILTDDELLAILEQRFNITEVEYEDDAGSGTINLGDRAMQALLEKDRAFLLVVLGHYHAERAVRELEI